MQARRREDQRLEELPIGEADPPLKEELEHGGKHGRVQLVQVDRTSRISKDLVPCSEAHVKIAGVSCEHEAVAVERLAGDHNVRR